MNYHKQYIKYKNKYLILKNKFRGGGDKIEASCDNSSIELITKQDELDKIKEYLLKLYYVCEPEDAKEMNEFEFHGTNSIYWLLKYKETNETIGFMQTTDLSQFEDEDSFELQGGIKDKKGLFITKVCNGNPNKFKNVATLLLQAINKYARDNYYDYLLLHASKERLYLHNEGERKGLYIKNGFNKTGYEYNGMYIMQKDL